MFAERGLDAEMKEIAERAGIGVGTIYRNFATKDELLGALAADAMVAIESHIDGCMDRADPLESLEVFLEGIFDMVDRYGHLMQLVMHQRHDLLDGRTKGRMLAKTESILARCTDAGVVRRDIPAATLAAVLHGFAHIYYELSGQVPRADARRACREMFLGGCASGMNAGRVSRA